RILSRRVPAAEARRQLDPEQVRQGHTRPAFLGASTAVSARHHGRRDSLGIHRDRLRIAQVAARLIVEHGLADWTLAKRKALRQLLLPDSTALPSNDEIEAALTEHHALFGGDAHVANLRRQREQALGWMRRLAPWDPLLVG